MKNSLPKLPKDLTKALTSYVIWNASFSYIYDEITDYIEKKNLKNETMKIKMIANDLWMARQMADNWEYGHADDQLAFVKRTLLYIK